MRRKNFDEPHGLGIAPEGDFPRAISDAVIIVPVLVILLIVLVFTRLF